MRGFFSIRRKRIVAFFLVLMLLASGFTVSAAGNGTSSDRQTIQEQSAAGSSEMEDSGTEPQSAVTQPAGNEEDTEEKTTKDNTKDNGDTKVVSVLSVDELAEETVISSDEETGIEQLANIIPDRNFRTEVWRSLSVAGQLGDPDDPQYEGLEGDELYKAVLGNFTGKVYASGYVKRIEYTASFQYVTPIGLQTYYFPGAGDGPCTDRQEAAKNLETAINFCVSEGYEIKEDSITIIGEVNVTEDLKPDDQLIEDITGVEYLRKAESIDFSNNTITSLMPLDRAKIADRFCGGSSIEAQKWFGDVARNTTFTFVGNPIVEFPTHMPGRILIDPLFNVEPVLFVREPVILLRNWDENLPLTVNIDMPEIKIGNDVIQFFGESLDIINNPQNPNTFGETLTAEYEPGDSGERTGGSKSGKIVVSGIYHSGEASFSIGTESEGSGGGQETDTIVRWNGVDSNDSVAPVACGVTVELHQQVRVLYEILPGEPDGSVEISFNKFELGTEHIVAGASYRLFRMETGEDGPVYSDNDKVIIRDEDGYAVNQDGEIIAIPIDNEGDQSEYVTDENGSFTCNARLEAGTYCFIETAAPAGYEVDTTPVMFTVGDTDTVKINGGNCITDVVLAGMPAESDNNTYQLYEYKILNNGISGWGLYDGDDNLSFSPDQNGKIKIEGLLDGTYQLRPVLAQSDAEIIEFQITDGKASVTKGENISADSEYRTYFDRYSDPVSIILPQLGEDQFLDSLIIEWRKADNSGIEQQIFTVGEDFKVGGTDYINASAADVVKAAQDFININKGNAEEAGFIQGQLTVSPVYKYKPEKPLQAEDPAKVQFSFVKTDGDPGKSLSGAEFTLYKADENWQWSEDVVYKTAVSAEQTGLVDFGYLDSGNYIMKETAPPPGYAALPGYWKITADAWAQEGEPKLTFTYVREDKTETKVSEDTIIPKDIYGNRYYIPNYPVDSLPSMGGNGTRIFTVFGLVFTGAALILFTCARRYKKIKGV